jgi:hypothetical protein
MNPGLLRQAMLLVALIGVAAIVIVGLGKLLLPGSLLGGPLDPPELADDFQGAVLTATGSPVDEGIILPRYEMRNGSVETGAVWDAEAAFTTGQGESVRFRWSWVDEQEGGETDGVWALFSVREGSFTAEGDECQLDIDRYEPYEELTTLESSDGTEEAIVVFGIEIEGSLHCENVPSRRIGEPISFDAVFADRMVQTVPD